MVRSEGTEGMLEPLLGAVFRAFRLTPFKEFAKPPPAIRQRGDGDGRLASKQLRTVRATSHPTVRRRRCEESGRR